MESSLLSGHFEANLLRSPPIMYIQGDSRAHLDAAPAFHIHTQHQGPVVRKHKGLMGIP